MKASRKASLCCISWCRFAEEHPGKKKEKRKDSAGSDDTASMIKGGGY